MNRISLRVMVVLLVMWGLLVFRLGAPWFGEQDAYRVWIASAVRNYDLYGVDTIGGMVVRDSIPVEDPDTIAFYSHHPPLLAWIPALLTRFTGYHELGVRFSFAAATLISGAAFYVLARRLYGSRVAFWSLVFYAFTPMVAYFGRVPGHDPLGIMAAMLFAAITVNWLRRPTRGRLLALFGLTWLAAWTAWPALFFVGVIGITAMLLGNRSHQLGVIGLGLSSVAAIVVMYGLYQSWWPQSVDSLLGAFVWRSSDAAGLPDAERFTLFQWVETNLVHLIFFYAPGLTAMAVIGVAAVRRHGSRFSNALLAALFAAGMAYLLVFRNAAYIHHYYKVVLVPALSILAAMAWVYTRKNPRVRRFSRPVMDGLLISSVISAVLVWGIAHYSGRQPKMQAVIDTINTSAPPDSHIAVTFTNSTYGTSSGYDRVTAFYTFRRIDWNLSPEAVIDAADGSPVLYIHCRDDETDPLPELLRDLPAEPVYEETCLAFRL